MGAAGVIKRRMQLGERQNSNWRVVVKYVAMSIPEQEGAEKERKKAPCLNLGQPVHRYGDNL